MVCFPVSLVFASGQGNKERVQASTVDVFLNADQEQVREGLALMRKDRVTAKSEVDRKAIEFLYIKEIIGPKSEYFIGKADRLFVLRCFIEKLSCPSEISFRKRILLLLNPEGDSIFTRILDKVQSLDSALKVLDDWNDVDEAYIFTRDHEAARGKDVLKQRLQRSLQLTSCSNIPALFEGLACSFV
jgi:hypothetical protein